MSEFVPAPAGTLAAFVVIVLLVQGLLLWAVWRSAPTPSQAKARTALTATAFVAAMALTALVAESGVMAREGLPPPPFVYFAVCNLTALGLALGGPGRAMAAAVAPAFWLLFHGFRLPLEGILHLWHEAGTIPVQMTWSGQNLDVVTGVLALVLGGVLLRAPGARWAGWLGHGVGLLLLLNVMRVAMTSVPGPLRSFDGPPLLLPFHAPYLWIVPFAVSAALFAHIVGMRALARTGAGGS